MRSTDHLRGARTRSGRRVSMALCAIGDVPGGDSRPARLVFIPATRSRCPGLQAHQARLGHFILAADDLVQQLPVHLVVVVETELQEFSCGVDAEQV